ncbi:N-acetylmuramoyl-L-alanine amidase [Bacillus salipaludis]|uniref:N-acetylmuramoyl-L-alanine amidase n=1 Tax=Bacillus salipaludis TaxID=2547811 RepID=A0A4R5VU51_9BACI|nr:N-acetylmuramoyl-L-alanine amidase [Bacillus salipaludis]
MVKIFVDPGHGGSDPGATGTGLAEKDVTHKIATRIRDMLEDEYENATVKMSRTGDQTVSLEERTDMANAWGADFYLAVHINSGGGTGYEDYIHDLLSNNSRTAEIQRTIHKEVIKLNDLIDRGIKKANYHVLRESNMDAMLSENGFIDNTNDLAKMKDPDWINNVARGHVNGLAKALNLHKLTKTTKTTTKTASDSKKALQRPASSSSSYTKESTDSKKKTLYLPASADSWRIYPLNKDPIKKNALPDQLRPSKYGGLQYEILGETWPNVYIIQTKQLGKVQIYAGPETGAEIK